VQLGPRCRNAATLFLPTPHPPDATMRVLLAGSEIPCFCQNRLKRSRRALRLRARIGEQMGAGFGQSHSFQGASTQAGRVLHAGSEAQAGTPPQPPNLVALPGSPT